LLDLTQGWVAVRVRPEWTPATAFDPYPNLLYARATVTNKLDFYFSSSGSQYSIERNNGTQNTVRQSRIVAPGVADTGDRRVGRRRSFSSPVNGAAFSTRTVGQIPSGLPATFSNGPVQRRGAVGRDGFGTLSDADSATLGALADADPRFEQLPGTPTVVWPAEDLDYLQPVTGATYSRSQATSGSPCASWSPRRTPTAPPW